jgi:membrane-bound lytic murein transglycosylase D
MTQRRNSKALLSGVLIMGISLLTAWAVDRDTRGMPEPAPMDEVLEATAASVDGVSWDLPVTRNEHVDTWIAFLKGRNHDKTDLWLERSGRYAPLIQAELRKRGMPEDLIYLAFIESGFSPKARSQAAAVGIWQFIAETGKRYGLEVSSYVDERRDPIKATGAALDYLQVLHDRFGSWYLAAAAYNTGENRVSRIMREETGSERGSDADFWRIASRLPRETRNYVPLMLAAGHIGKEPDKYGFDDVEYYEPLAFHNVWVPQSVPLAAVAKATHTSEEIISDLNPELVRGVTPPDRGWSVRVPVGAEQQFAQNFPAALNEVRLAAKSKPATGQTKHAGATHRVKRGETLSHIAKRYGVSVNTIVNANGDLLPSRLQIGQALRIPGAGGHTKLAGKSKSSSSRFHSVRRGENLSLIAARYETSVTKLKRLNGLRGSTIRPGQRLRIA